MRKTAGARRAAIFFNFAAAVLRNRGTAGVSELRETLVASSTPPIDARDRLAFKFCKSPSLINAASPATGATSSCNGDDSMQAWDLEVIKTLSQHLGPAYGGH